MKRQHKLQNKRCVNLYTSSAELPRNRVKALETVRNCRSSSSFQRFLDLENRLRVAGGFMLGEKRKKQTMFVCLLVVFLRT